MSEHSFEESHLLDTFTITLKNYYSHPEEPRKKKTRINSPVARDAEKEEMEEKEEKEETEEKPNNKGSEKSNAGAGELCSLKTVG